MSLLSPYFQKLANSAPADLGTYGPDLAGSMLADLDKALNLPVIHHVLGTLASELDESNLSVLGRTLLGFQDVVNQQQLIGETRGLLRFFAKLDSLREELLETAKQKD